MDDLTPTMRGIRTGPRAEPVSTAIAIGLAGGGFAVPTAAQFFIAKLIVSTVVSIAISAVSSALTKKPKPPASSNFTAQLRDRTITARQPIAPRRIIYGESRVGGVYTFIHTTGDSNEFLNLVITLSGHEINAVSGLFFDGVEVPLDGNGDATGDFSGFVHMESNLGTSDQAAFQGLINEAPDKWTVNDRQQGCAGVYLRLKYDADKFPNGIPALTFGVLGKNDVFDPRTSLTEYSNNAALCCADYISLIPFGLEAVYSTEILDADLIEAANICEEQVQVVGPTFSRASIATYFRLGILETAAIDELRFLYDALGDPTGDLIESEATNDIRNNTMQGVSAGSPGTLPTNWAVTALGTLTQTVVGSGTLDGIEYVDIRFSGTPSGDPSIHFDTATDIDALTGETWTESAYIALVAGDLSNINTMNFQQFEYTEVGGFVTLQLGPDLPDTDLTANLERFEYTATLSGGATVAHVRPALLINWDGSGDVDITIRIGLPQQEQGSSATSVIKTSSEAVTRAADDLGIAQTENRYEANGTLETDATPFENLQSLTGAMAGAVITQGKLWTIRAGAYRAPEISALEEGDFIGPIDTQTLITRAKSFNGVKGVFSSPDNDWQPDDFPAVQVQAYVDADNGEAVWGEVTLPLTSSVTMSQRIARIMLELSRRQINVVVPTKMIAYQLQPYDTVPLTIDRYGWTDKTFRVENMQLVLDKAWSIRLNIQEIDANAYTWSTADAGSYEAAPTTTLPGAFDTTPPGLTVTDDIAATPTGGAVTNLIATVQPPSDAFVSEFEVEFKLSTDPDSAYISMGRSTNTIYQTSNVVDGKTYDVRARTISVIGVKSDFSAVNQHTVIGQTALPPDVDEFSISIVDGAANLSWLPVEVVDLSHYRIRHSGALSGATWSSAITLVDRVGKPATSITVPALVGTYLIKAVDYGVSGDGSDGRESENAALIVSNVEALRTFNAVEAVQEDPTFPGVKDQTIVVGSTLTLDYDGDLFARADYFGVADFFLGDDGFYSEGFYNFENIIDLGSIYTSRVTAAITVNGENQNEDLFARPDYFDVADFFGVDPSQWGAELQIRTTDDPTSSPIVWTAWQPFVTGDYSARGLDFRIKLTSNEFAVTPVVSGLGVTVDMPDETRAQEDLVVTVSGLTITFAPAFRSLKGLSISAQGLATGDYYSITSKDAVGFDIAFFDSSDSAIQRTFDYVAVGYGRLE